MIKFCLTLILFFSVSVSFATENKCEESLFISSNWRERSSLVTIIQRLALVFADLSPRNLLDHEQKVRQLMLTFTGRSVGPKVICNAGAKEYGTWLEALEAAGLTNLEPTKRRLIMVWSREKVISALQMLGASYSEMNRVALRPHAADIQEALFQKFQRAASLDGLYHAVKNEFGSWILGLRAAGLGTVNIKSNVQQMEWDRPLVITVLRQMAGNDISMHRRTFLNQTYSVRDVMLDHHQLAINSKTIVAAAERIFGTWLSAVEAADEARALELKMNLRPEWSVDKIIEVLKFLSTEFKDMNLAKLQLQNAKVRELTFQKFGRQIGMAALRRAAYLAIPGGWPGALTAAQIDTKKIRRREAAVEWSEELLVDVLYQLSKKRLNMKLLQFFERSERVRELTLNQYHRAISTFSIYTAAIEYYGGWKKALEAAGVQAQMPREAVTSNVTIIPQVVTFEFQSDGTARKIVQHGNAPRTPEEHLAEKEIGAHVDRSISGLEGFQQELSLLILEYLEENDGLEDQARVLKFVSENSGQEFAWGDIERVLESMADDLRSSWEP